MKTSNYLKSLFVIISLLLSLDLQAQVVSDTVNVQTAGTLSSLILATDKYQITNLTVTGDLNGTDIRYIREMAGSDVNGNSTLGKLSVLDLSGTNIVAGGSSYYNNYTTSLNEIGFWTFSDCTGLTSVTIPDGVTSIENDVFDGCTGLTLIIIPNSVTSIGGGAFSHCTGLTSITIPNSVTSIGNTAFYGCTGLTSITIPDSVTSIGDGAFSHCTGLISITIPSSVISIGDNAFTGCTGLTSITIPNGVTSIGSYAFDGCIGLTSIAIPSSVISIGDNAFTGCTGLTSITISDGVKFIWSYVFQNCTRLTSIAIPNSVTSIGGHAFQNCIELTSITIPDGVTSIGGCAFYGCTKLKEFIVSENNPAYNSVEGVLFSKNCTELIAYPNAKSNICTLPNSVTSIGNAAFYGCTGLASITLPNSVTSIENYAFTGCTGITEVHCKILAPQSVNSSVFSGINKTTCKLYIPKGTYLNYLEATGWNDFTNIIEEEATAISQIEASDVRVYTDQDAIIVAGADLGDYISVYTESGALLQTTKVTDNTIRITVPGNKIYFIKTTDKIFKVAL
ncbi:leucine-rich repeat protein [uncultured Bacteroides sp.]|uniref:leucine-rich repeat domain-containing protein n=1 Tax=uncultured Bacteroides sp. TaxID=162156 RepID=UPI002AAAC18E|nr:leucine-rich repeat protein [uncultured Bacteroides sp.]